jgi:hypothetical protein
MIASAMRTSKWTLMSMLVLTACMAGAQQTQATGKFDSATVSGLPARNIGSATMSGRIAALDAVRENGRLTMFVGSASGGVWKSVNGGTTFTPVFDRQPVQSIGAVAIDPSNSKNVWVGTGEAWVRNSVSVGDGVYRSTDGGENWVNVGLKDSERIAKIIVDPRDGNTALACAVGHLWNDNEERGVYKTTDGGKTWRKVLAGANPSTGCAMMTASKTEPGTLFAGMWDFRRQGWTFGWTGKRTVQVHGRGRALDGTDDAERQGTAGETVWSHRGDGRAGKTADGVRVHRVKIERTLSVG